MALRDQPYIPLYVQDYLTDEKLNLCTASTQGIYIKIMCIMHKSDEYGCILLEQKFKQNDNQINNFAYKIGKLLPFTIDEIISALNELLEYQVLNIDSDKLYQKRMVKDNSISLIRADSGSKGGKKTQLAKANIKAKVKAKKEQNPEYENENEDENEIKEIRKNCSSIFSDYYKTSTGFKFIWDVKHRTGMIRIVNSLIQVMIEEKNPIDNESVSNAFKFILDNITDPWILKNLTPALLASKINELFINIGKNGKRSQKPATSDEQLRDIIEASSREHTGN